MQMKHVQGKLVSMGNDSSECYQWLCYVPKVPGLVFGPSVHRLLWLCIVHGLSRALCFHHAFLLVSSRVTRALEFSGLLLLYNMKVFSCWHLNWSSLPNEWLSYISKKPQGSMWMRWCSHTFLLPLLTGVGQILSRFEVKFLWHLF